MVFFKFLATKIKKDPDPNPVIKSVLDPNKIVRIRNTVVF